MRSGLGDLAADPPAATPSGDAEGLTLRQWLIILTVSIGALLEIIDVSITNVALLHIQASLGATLAEVGWVVTGYAMASVIMIPLSEWLGELFGQRSYFVFCLVGFTAASLLCGLATNLPLLVLARILQGILGGGLLPKAQAILFRTVPPSLQGTAQAVFGIVVLAGPALGPTLGGVLTDSLGWRWVFFINVPLGLLTVAMALAFLDGDGVSASSGGRRPRIDWVGIGLMALSLGSLQLVLEQGHQYDWFDNQGIRSLALLALVGLPCFVAWELRRRDPAVDLRVLRHRSLAAGSVFSFVLGIGLYGTIFVVPVFAQSVLSYTATQTGMLLLPGALASALTMAVLGRLSARFDPRALIAVGALLMVFTMVSLAAIGPDTGADQLFWPLILRGVTTVMMFLPLSLATLGPLPRADVGAGSGFYNLSRQLGGTFGIAVLTVTLDHQLAVHRAQLVEHLPSTSPLLQLRLTQMQAVLLGGGADAETARRQALELLSHALDRQAALLAYGDVFRLVALVFLLAIPLVLLLGRGGSTQAATPH
jgi:DHA2 family multidrug resistance protein